MRFTGSRIGPRGLAVLTAAALAGAVLAVHGWSARHRGLTAGSVVYGSSSPAPATRSPTPDRSSPAARPRPAGSSAAASPGASRSPGASPAATAGPLLSSQSFAQYSFRVWPGTLTAAARAALTGLSVSVRRHSGGLSVTAGVNGQPAGGARFYPGGAQVYVVEASLGDDSGTSDYNLGDDSLVVTTAQGRIVS